ncbi:MAG: L-rhamnose isomerase [Verrucomicrobia bacterium]|nr:L-rhamnose isomerase [Verrucomicrobiota bacterium]
MSTPAYALAREAYASFGIDTEQVLATLAATPISLHCWQGDDVGGFERAGATLEGGGIQATGNYPGKARTLAELRQDLDTALSLIPGKHRLNLHAIYGDFGGKKVERNAIGPEHFQSWIDWAKSRGLGLDFNPTCFSHPLANDGFTLSHRDAAVRQFWIEHAIACRRIGAAMGQALGTPTVTNVWIPDGHKDLPADRKGPRERLAASLDAVFKEPIDERIHRDAVECKLFGIGSESYVVGSHEFYLGYAVTRKKTLCLDMGHFHPTESVADKVSSVLQYVPYLLLHVSRGVRWDSDHVVLLDDPTRALFEELVRGGFLPRTAIGLDYFDASINRVAAWVLGTRNALKCLLLALLEPSARLRELEAAGDHTGRLVLLEELKTLPFAAVWDEHCRRQNAPGDRAWLPTVQRYEREHLAQRK